MEKYRAPNGVELSYASQGTGPFVTLVHGVGADHASWDAIANQLQPHFAELSRRDFAHELTVEL